MKAESITTPGYQAVLLSPLPGSPSLGLRTEGEHLIAIDYLWQKPLQPLNTDPAPHIMLLQCYFKGEWVHPGLLVKPSGTPFQQRVWQALMAIPPGEVVTYGELARQLDSSPRAVAGACRANPIPILIPCHRVIAANGPGGYMGKVAGRELAIKQWLLRHEGHV